MLRLPDGTLDPATQTYIDSRQAEIDGLPNYADRVARGKSLWDNKKGPNAGDAAFKVIRDELEHMCFGAVRCAYCNDSAADEIEHVLPKDFFPDQAFRWSNYVFACGPCNGTYKSNKYAYLDARGRRHDVTRVGGAVLTPPPVGRHALIDPRTENPLNFLTLDLLANDPVHGWIEGEFLVVPLPRLRAADRVRAEYTRETLGLNRQLLLDARRNAYGSFRARIVEYAGAKAGGAPQIRLDALRDGILRMPHPMVFVEMQRQRRHKPLKDLFAPVPEALTWTFGRLAPVTRPAPA
ncbi:HNH endonuclease family protein [Azospirillum isscasi]|uniref:TIGR02646 family protein n=1 Tax=Azospirillum isscasi TaxID=3053926 RepID=A0ABU0WMS9_9PROT|nr:hypothetical protein [Azospirillum isscasi]MDQ2105523.1 hypothetical protein [Azospirillum isscasi]